MTHVSDDDLVLHYYGDPAAPRGIEPHLAGCAECRERYREWSDSLAQLAFRAEPEIGERYGQELWHRLEPRLPQRAPFWSASWFRPLVLASAAALLLVIGFGVGRIAPGGERTAAPAHETSDLARRRVLLMSVADHLEASDRVLTDLLHADGGRDISAEQAWAADLVSASRFYRQDALASDEGPVAAVLEELERALLDIVHSPAKVTEAELEQMHRRVDSAALLFKVRVMGGDLRERGLAPSTPARSTTTRSRIS